MIEAGKGKGPTPETTPPMAEVDGMISAIDPATALDLVCVCGHQARRHHPKQHAHSYTCSLCPCMYFEVAPIDPARPAEAQLADAIRCTAHIEDRLLRAKYVLTDMRLRGFVLQRVTRDKAGRFVREPSDG